MPSTPPIDAVSQQVLVELNHWLGRVAQYSPSHPACNQLAERLHDTLTRALATDALLAFGVLKDNVMIGEVPAAHPAVRTRLAHYLHERGILMLRFLHGVTLADLHAFMEILVLPVQTVFDRGGVQELAIEHGITRIQVEELAHELSAEQLETAQRRQRLRDFFADALRHLLARRKIDAAIDQHITELLEHPEITVAILEDQGSSVAEAAAGMALMTRQQEERAGTGLAPKLREIFAALAPLARERLLLGFPTLIGEFRAALAWAMAGYREEELARFTFPAFRARAHELEPALYALSVMVPHDGTRLSTLRRVGLMLHDLPVDDTIAVDVLTDLAQPVETCDSFRRERLCLAEPAARALVGMSFATLAARDTVETEPTLAPLDERGVFTDLVNVIARTKQFDRFCRRLPEAANALASDGSRAALLGLYRALTDVQRPEWHDLASGVADTVASAHGAALLKELELTTADLPSSAWADVSETVRHLVASEPRAAVDHLLIGENQQLRGVLHDALATQGARLLPLLRPKLAADAPPTVVHVIALLHAAGGGAHDLVEVARSRHDKVRMEIVRVLRVLTADEHTTDIALRYQTDPSEDVRHAARLLVRGDFMSAAAVAVVARLLADVAQPDDLQRRLIDVLGHSRQDAAAQLLARLLQPHGLIENATAAAHRDLAAVALRACPAPSAARLFQEGLASTSRRVRKACERAAGGGT